MRIVERLKSFWASRKPRERAMALCCAAILAALWFTLLSRKNAEYSERMLDLGRRMATARAAIAGADAVAAAETELSKSFDPSKALSADKFQAEIDRCAREAGVEYRLSSVASSAEGRFKVYRATMQISRTADLPSIMRFEAALKALRPYVSIAEASFSGDGKGAVSAQYSIVSFSL